MQLTIFNGSPRGKGSNTKILMDHFTSGMTAEQDHIVETRYLNRLKDMKDNAELFGQSENVILAFPLYTDSMPGIVMEFIENLAPLCGENVNATLGFVVQSGFPETHHSRFIEKYLVKLCRRLKCSYSGTIIKGGVEGIQIKPSMLTRKLYNAFYDLGVEYGKTGTFDDSIIQMLAKRERLSAFSLMMFRILGKTGLMDFYWDSQLKKNGAFKNRFDRPFG